jgi:hypothetical protein
MQEGDAAGRLTAWRKKRGIGSQVPFLLAGRRGRARIAMTAKCSLENSAKQSSRRLRLRETAEMFAWNFAIL